MTKYVSGVILYDETIARTPRTAPALVKLIEKDGALGIQGGRRPKAHAVLARRGRFTGGARWDGERLIDYREPRRQVRQVARRDRHRQGHPDL